MHWPDAPKKRKHIMASLLRMLKLAASGALKLRHGLRITKMGWSRMLVGLILKPFIQGPGVDRCVAVGIVGGGVVYPSAILFSEVP